MFDFGFHFFNSSRGGIPPTPPFNPDHFIIKVKTDNAGTSGANQFTLPLPSSGTYNYDIDWGDGVVENHTTNTSKTHTYPSAGEYIITISGTFPRILFNNGGDRRKLIETINFGDVGWTNFFRGFSGCSNNIINENCTGNFDNVVGAQEAWLNNNLTSFPAIDMPNCITFARTWQNNNLTTFPNIDISKGGDFLSCWGNNNLTSFPSLNMDSATRLGVSNQTGAWENNNLTSFPAIDMPNVTNASRAWASNNLETFPLVQMPKVTSIQGAWRDNNLTTFPAIDLPNATNVSGAWQGNGVMTSFDTRNFYSMTNGINTFLGTTLPTSDYSDILITQRANNNNNDVTFHGGNSKYNTAGGIARDELTDTVANGGQNWSITDGGAE